MTHRTLTLKSKRFREERQEVWKEMESLLQRIESRSVRNLTDDEIIALSNRLVPVGTEPLVAQPFECLIQRDHEEQKEGDVGDTAHNRDVGFAEPAQWRDMRPCRDRAAKAEQQRKRGRDRKQRQNKKDGGQRSRRVQQVFGKCRALSNKGQAKAERGDGKA